MSTLGRLLGHIRPYAATVIGATLMLAISGALMSGIVATVKPLVNDVLLPAATGEAAQQDDSGSGVLGAVRELLPTDTWSRWTRGHAYVEVPLLIILAYLLRTVLSYFGEYAMVKSGVRMIRDLRVELYATILRQSAGFFREHPTGVILARVLADVQMLQRVVTTSMANGLRVAAMVPFLFIVAFVHDWRLSLMVVVALPLIGYPMVRLGRKLRRAATASQAYLGGVAHTLSETVGGVRIVQGFGMEQYESERFGAAVERTLRADLRAGRASALAPALIELVSALIGAALFFVAGREIAAERLDPGDFAAVLFCLGLLFASTRRLNAFYAEIQRALASAVRVFDMLDRRPEIRDRADATELPSFAREIRFEGVRFSYGDEQVLDGIELTIERGEVVALVGASGAGKTTLVNLLPRFFDVSSGALTIDGHDVRAVTLRSLRSQIGIVTQEPILFDDSVRNNIAYGRVDCPQERVVQAARAARAHEFIEALPDGYETVLGERGVRLSQGQRQRVTIARALLENPPILILDEATSALDAESEALVQTALDELMRGRTSLVIAHRLSTVRRAKRIVVLERGRIVEVGSHDELLAKQGVYARLHAIQFREQDAPHGSS